ncbi:MAG: hypothetical protein HWD60_00125 [Defluviicoccus sp.]|nr:MAG: hypothetical protein HWD60_00125 [Defluviicoccus sp.]
MTQASDLGGIANQLAALFRARVNVGFQAVVTQHYGGGEPAVTYANMVWFDSGTDAVKLRDPTNTSWAVIGQIGPPFKWTAVDLPQTSFTTGDVKLTFKTTADSGWVMMNDGTIGDAVSGATTRAHADAEALFTLLWSSVSDTWCTLYGPGGYTPSGRGVSAATDWAAHRHIALPKVLGRAIAAAGWGAGLSNVLLAAHGGAETVLLGANHIPAHTHGAGTLAAASAGAHTHAAATAGPAVSPNDGFYNVANGGGTTGSGGAHTHTIAGSTGSAGGGEAHSNIQPTAYCNVMIKL